MRVLVLAQCLLFAGPLAAEAQTFGLVGGGMDSCGQWVSSSNNGMHVVYMSWVLGYLSAYSMMKAVRTGQDTRLSQSDLQALDLWMTNYCNANPLKSINDGAYALAVELTK